MGLFAALNVAVTGLRINQQGLEVVSGNIANSETPGYTRKTLGQYETAVGGQIIGVRKTEVSRELDALLQRQIRNESGSSGYFDIRAEYLARLDQSFGTPGGANALDTLYNNLTSSLQALTTSPDSPSVRTNAVNEADFFARRLNTLSEEIQAMRTEAEVRLADAVDEVNELLTEIERLTNVVISQSYLGSPEASLLDQRDRNIDALSKLLDIQVINNDGTDLKIFTNSGVSLFDKTAVTMSFDQRNVITATNFYSSDPAERTVGTIKISSGVGEVDLLSADYIRSGEIAAYVELRDQILVDAQAQLDEIAHNLALA
ncbi:MAG: flagellar hook-associated protein FlgK, partial [Hyphomicrobiales bacterium]|nr:flagellar hook-associated protein FlgK [Hyphomicrobiales bacterium]